MASVRRAGAGLLATLVLTAFTAVPARGQSTAVADGFVITVPAAFRATAGARALDLNLFGNHITVGSTLALIDSTVKAQSQGAGVLLVAGTIVDAVVTGLTGEHDPPPACVLNLPLLGLLNLAVACGDAKALIGLTGPAASAAGGVASIELGLSVLDPLVDQLLALVGATIGAVVDPLLVLLGGLLSPLLAALDLDLTNLVDDLVAGLRRATSILRVTIGTSAVETVAGSTSVTSRAVAAGGQIDLLPGLTLTGAPLLSIIVGSAAASLAISRPGPASSITPAVAVPSFDPAIVTVRLGLPLLGSLTEIPVRLGAPLTLLAGTPLESTISLGAGRAVQGSDGSGSAVADGVSIQLLKGLGGGIGLDLAHAEVEGRGVSAQIVPRQVNPPQIQPEPEPQAHPRTGGTPLLPMTGFGLVLAALVVRRVGAVRA